MATLTLPHGGEHNTQVSVGTIKPPGVVDLYARETNEGCKGEVSMWLTAGETRALIALLDAAATELEREAGEYRIPFEPRIPLRGSDGP